MALIQGIVGGLADYITQEPEKIKAQQANALNQKFGPQTPMQSPGQFSPAGMQPAGPMSPAAPAAMPIDGAQTEQMSLMDMIGKNLKEQYGVQSRKPVTLAGSMEPPQMTTGRGIMDVENGARGQLMKLILGGMG